MVSETEGPTDQKRLDQSSRCPNTELSNPPSALRVKVGYNAAVAIPICALAAAIVRSEVAMSGLRSSNCDGTPAGIGGGAAFSGFTGMENEEGPVPISTAIA